MNACKISPMYRGFAQMLIALLIAIANPAPASEAELRLVIAQHKFAPAELRMPAGRRLKLLIENRDASAEEFDSYDLNREKVIAGNSSGFIWVGPLKPGRYAFVGEFNPASARGTLIAE